MNRRRRRKLTLPEIANRYRAAMDQQTRQFGVTVVGSRCCAYIKEKQIHVLYVYQSDSVMSPKEFKTGGYVKVLKRKFYYEDDYFGMGMN